MEPALLRRSMRLEPVLASAGEARRFVLQTLVEAGAERWADAAVLAVSEVVTNAVVHAGTGIEVIIEAAKDAATIRVHDHSPRIPAQRHWGAFAATGRGLALVARVCSAYGVQELTDDGKIVWFRVDDAAPSAEDDGNIDLEMWLETAGELAVDDAGHDATSTPVIRLVGVPVTLWSAAQQQYEAILRELVLLAGGDQAGDIAAFTHADLTAAKDALAAVSEAVTRTATAHDHATDVVTVEMRLGVDDASKFALLRALLTRGRQLAIAERLLTRPSLPEIVALRDWVCLQAVAQLDGGVATPWRGFDHDEPFGSSEDEEIGAPRWDDRKVRLSDRAVVAADDRNRIIAVSRAAADLVGWAVDELVGLRLVTLVPQQLRQAHIAGFTRHIATGEERVLNTDLTVPVLHADGHEIACWLRIEREPNQGLRGIYLGWFEPISS